MLLRGKLVCPCETRRGINDDDPESNLFLLNQNWPSHAVQQVLDGETCIRNITVIDKKREVELAAVFIYIP